MNLCEWGLGAKGCAPNVVVYENPLYSWLDESETLKNEGWRDDPPRLVAYYTCAMTDADPILPPDDHDFPSRQHPRVVEVTGQWLHDNMGWFWPRGTTPYAPRGLDPALIRSAYYRANIAPTDRYTLSVPGSGKFRLGARESGFGNLFLAGDWTDFCINVGYFEGAIISGLRAAHAIMDADGWPVYESVLEAEDVERREQMPARVLQVT